MGNALKILIIEAMQNHVYTFNSEARIQSEGGPIGLSLTGELADMFMVEWDKKVLKELEKVGVNILLYGRFKDDINVAAIELENGTKFVNGKLIIDKDKEKTDEKENGDQITMKIIREEQLTQ